MRNDRCITTSDAVKDSEKAESQRTLTKEDQSAKRRESNSGCSSNGSSSSDENERSGSDGVRGKNDSKKERLIYN